MFNLRRAQQTPFRRITRPHKFTGYARRFKSDQQAPQDRIDRINSRLPRFLHRYTSRLRSAPLTHITSFLILHEITAIVPIFGFAALFHYTQWLPPFISEWKYLSDGVEKFGRYFRRKGWLGEMPTPESADADTTQLQDAAAKGSKAQKTPRRARAWGWGEGGVKIVVEFASAYALTKVLLPLRLVASVAATPWFARVAVIPCLGLVKRVFWRRGGGAAKHAVVPGAGLSPAGGTNAVAGGVVAAASKS